MPKEYYLPELALDVTSFSAPIRGARIRTDGTTIGVLKTRNPKRRNLALYFPPYSTKPCSVNNESANVPSPVSVPPPIGTPPPIMPSSPVGQAAGGPAFWRKLLAGLLSLFLALLVANAAVSVLDDSFELAFGSYLFTFLSGLFLVVTVLAAVVVYGLMALTPMIPKRIFLPAVFMVLSPFFLVLPLIIYFYSHAMLLDWFLSWAEVIFAMLLLRWVQGGWKFRWPLVAEKHLGARAFSWWNLLVFVLLNLIVILPAAAGYVAGCASLAVSRFSDGFVSLRPAGVILQARKYVRDDGRTVVLIPMSHIAESDFYRSVAGSVTSNSVVLLEGVTDTENLLTNRLTYRRAAKALHLAEQHDDFDLKQGTLVRADVDIREFSSNTIALLNLVALVHSEGLNAHTLSLLLQVSPSEEAERQLLNDLLVKRNQHVLGELFARLPQADSFIIPWGAAHMSGLAKEIQKAGFHLVGTRDYVSIRFGSKKEPAGGAGWEPPPGKD